MRNLLAKLWERLKPILRIKAKELVDVGVDKLDEAVQDKIEKERN